MKNKKEGLGMHQGAPPPIFAYAYRLRRPMTPAETRLWERLKGKQLNGHKFRRQHPIAYYILDFYCHKARLAVELDGGYHFTPEQELKDQRRTDHLNEMGVEVIRFENAAVLNDIDTVLEQIDMVVERRVRELEEEEGKEE